jgi:hypothetical protein
VLYISAEGNQMLAKRGVAQATTAARPMSGVLGRPQRCVKRRAMSAEQLAQTMTPQNVAFAASLISAPLALIWGATQQANTTELQKVLSEKQVCHKACCLRLWCLRGGWERQGGCQVGIHMQGPPRCVQHVMKLGHNSRCCYPFEMPQEKQHPSSCLSCHAQHAMASLKQFCVFALY